MSLENISKTAYCIIENRDSQLETCIRTTEKIISSGWRTKTASLHLKLSLSLIFITLCFPCNCIIFLHNYADIKKITNLTLSRLDLSQSESAFSFPGFLLFVRHYRFQGCALFSRRDVDCIRNFV